MLSSVPSTLVSKVAAYVSAVCCVTGPGWPSVPAMLTAASRRPKAPDGSIDLVAHIVLVAYVRTDEFGFRAKRAQLANEGLTCIVRATGDDDTVALLRKSK